jgi:MazG family protein
VRRHPHIFDPSGRPLDTPGQVHQQWEQIKAKEQADAGERRSVLSGIPRTLPSLLRSYEISMRVAAVGFEWARPIDVVNKIEEEIAELREAIEHEGAARSEEEMGDLLFSISNLCRKLGMDPESALRKANEKFTKRFTALEDRLHAQGRSVHEATLEEMEREWENVKGTTGHASSHEDH